MKLTKHYNKGTGKEWPSIDLHDEEGRFRGRVNASASVKPGEMEIAADLFAAAPFMAEVIEAMLKDMQDPSNAKHHAEFSPWIALLTAAINKTQEGI